MTGRHERATLLYLSTHTAESLARVNATRHLYGLMPLMVEARWLDTWERKTSSRRTMNNVDNVLCGASDRNSNRWPSGEGGLESN